MMFTPEQLKEAHSMVKSGADFPAYIQTLKKLGVQHYTTFVSNGNADYHGEGEHLVSTGAKYDMLSVSDTSNITQFKADLKAHQQGQTNFLTFCRDCAKSGIEKWIISINDMTCTYYNKAGQACVIEQIPGID
jgi:uncharacterized protein YbcV (DUF1398 family)